MGRKPLGTQAMTATERQRRCRARQRQEEAFAALCEAWEACSKRERSRFLRELRADKVAAKQKRRAEKVRALGEKTRRLNELRASNATHDDNGNRIVDWLAGFPIIHGPEA